MDIPKVTLPKIIPADKALKKIRKYNPTQIVGEINWQLESFISNITDIGSANTKLNIGHLCAGYMIGEIELMVAELIKEYTANGYIINYKVFYWVSLRGITVITIDISDIRFDTSKITKPVDALDEPPTYQESMKKRHSFFKRLACGLI